MSGQKRFWPLEVENARKFEEAAEDHDDFLTSLTGRSLIMLGLRPMEYTHTLDEWIERRGSRLMFAVRPYHEIPGMDGTCIQGTGAIGQQNPEGKSLYERGEPCAKCRRHGDNNKFLGKSTNASREYALHKSPELKRLWKDFAWWFEQNERIPFGNDGVNRRVREIAEKAGIGESRGYRELKTQGQVVDISAYDLRNTYGTRLARMEFEPYEIMQQMGHGSLSMPKKYIDFTGVRQEQLMEEKWNPDVY